MKKILTFVVLAVALFAMAANAQEQAPLKKVYNEEINPLEQIDQALAQARAEGKFVICQVGGNWCPWCLRIADFITNDSTISSLVEQNFVYIHVNYHPRKATEWSAAMMKRLNNPERFGFPVFVVLDEKGNVLHIQDSSFLEEGQGYNKEKVLRFFQNWTPKAIHEITMNNQNKSTMKEIDYKDLKINPFTLIGDEWMLVTAGNEQTGCNTMTASWGHLGSLWGHDDPTAVIYLRPTRYTKQFVDREGYFTLCIMDDSFKEQMVYLGTVSGRDEDKIAHAGITPVFDHNSVYFAEAKLVLVCKKLYASELQESGFIHQETINESYPLRDFHTMYVGKIEKVLVRDNEYLK